MSFNSNPYKGRLQRIDVELDKLLKKNAINTGMSIPRISNELANYLKNNGWEFTTPRININNGHKKRKGKYA